MQGDLNREITALVYHSEKACEGCAFVCIEGTEADGHDFAEEAVRKGAAAVICQRIPDVPQHVTVIVTENSRKIMAQMASVFYREPARSLCTIGVTGTKGKTTTTYMIQQILQKAGKKCGLIGTVQIDTGSRVIESARTTPESVEIQQYLREMADCGCDAAVIEVSSQAMKLCRADEIFFDYGVFTNLSEDHIGPGEHRDFAEYAACKAKLFQRCREGIVNGDDPYVDVLCKDAACKVMTYGMEAGRNLQAQQVDYVKIPGKLGVEFQVTGDYNINLVTGLPGKFSCYNALAAIAVCSRMGVDAESIRKALYEICVPGRQEMFSAGASRVIMVDYAHNGVALENLLTALRVYHPKKLTCVFGCGGQRDPNRRYQMAEAAARYADFTVVTSDNPRGELPSSIIADIVSILVERGANFAVIPDRRQAIFYAAQHIGDGEIAVIAGKGHENYQCIGAQKIHFDDREEVRASIEKVKHERNYFRTN